MLITSLFNKSSKPAWTPPGTPVRVGSFDIPGGMLYIGSELKAASGRGLEPALIDPSLAVDTSLPLKAFRWSSDVGSYAAIGPKVKAVYLQWLAGGRIDAETSTGCLMLFLFGLERRILHDWKKVGLTEQVDLEISAISKELERLIALYGKAHPIFSASAAGLLDYIAAVKDPELKEQVPWQSYFDVAVNEGLRRLPKLLQTALGQIAGAGQPIPADLAYLWYLHAPSIRKRDVYKVIPVHYRTLFVAEYEKAGDGDGIVLEGDFEKISTTYQPSSPTFGPVPTPAEALVELPDVAKDSKALRILERIGAFCDKQLYNYGVFIRTFPERHGSMEALSELPVDLWPAGRRFPFEKALTAISNTSRPYLTTLDKLLNWLPKHVGAHVEQSQIIEQALSKWWLSVEPPLTSSSPPEMQIALFSTVKSPNERVMRGEIEKARLMYQILVVAVKVDAPHLLEDYDVMAGTLRHWPLLTDAERAMLKAYIWLQLAQAPAPLPALMAPLKAFSPRERLQLAEFLTMAAEDLCFEGAFLMRVLAQISVAKMKISSAEAPVILLEGGVSPGHKIRKAPRSKSPDVSLPVVTLEVVQPKPQFVLDMSKVALLQAESAEVSSMLTAIFNEEDSTPNSSLTVPTSDKPMKAPFDASHGILMGLDTVHSEFTRLLLTKSEWSRAALEAAASERGLMLDGALERINEAAFDIHDDPLFEGDDIIEINQDIAKELIV